MEILDRTSRLDQLADLSRAGEVALRENTNVAAQHLAAHGSMFEMVTAQRVMVPRDLPAFIQRVKHLAAVAGDDYYYSFPVRTKNKQTGKWEDAPPIEGPSIQLAQDLAREYGNCAIDTRIVDIGDKWVIYARFTDYERGFSQVRPFVQRKNQASVGTKDQGRQEDLAIQIGVSKAIRNVVVKSLETFSTMMFEEARTGLSGAVRAKIEHYKARIQDRLKALGVPLDRVQPFIGKPIAQWNEYDTTRVVMELKSVAEGMATPDELWPAPEKFIDPSAKTEASANDAQAVEQRTEPSGGSTQESASAQPAASLDTAKGPAAGDETLAQAGGPAHAGNGGAPQGGTVKTTTAEAAGEVDEVLGSALNELGKLRDISLINRLDEVCREQLSDMSYEQFAEAKEARFRELRDAAKRDAEEAHRKAKRR